MTGLASACAAAAGRRPFSWWLLVVLSGCGGPPSEDGADVDALGDMADGAETSGPAPGHFELTPVDAWGRARGLGGPGSADGDFYAPTGIALSRDESEVFVYDTGNDRIKVLDRDGTTLRVWPHRGAGCAQWGSALGVLSNDSVVVVDSTAHEVVHYSRVGEQLERWPIPAAGNFCAQQDHDHSLVVDSDDSTFVGEIKTGQIHHFNSAGHLVASFGGLGAEKGRFSSGPMGLALLDGRILATDAVVREFRHRLLVFERGGRFVEYINLDVSQPSFGTCLATTPGWLFLFDDDNPPRMYQLAVGDRTASLAWTARGRGTGLGNLNMAYAAVVTSDNLLLITEPNLNHRVQVFRLDWQDEL